MPLLGISGVAGMSESMCRIRSLKENLADPFGALIVSLIEPLKPGV